jgi:hypothetical protein
MRKHKYTKPLTIYLEPEKFSLIEKITNNREISMGSWFRNLADVELARDQQKQKLPAGAKKGLI